LITQTQLFEGSRNICDILAIEDNTHYLLACEVGILKTTQDFQLLNIYFDRMSISCLSHLSGSLCLVGLYDKKELVVWDERTDAQLASICNDIRVLSI
jgi:hypothetical protein